MKKSIKFIVLTIMTIVALSFSALAISVDYTIEAYDADANQYDMYVKVKNEGGCTVTVSTKFTFNNEKLILANSYDYTPVDLTTVTDEPILPATVPDGRKTVSYSLSQNTWTTTGNKTQAYITVYQTPDVVNSKFGDVQAELDAIMVTFNLADGVTLKDIAPEDFVVDYILVADETTQAKYGYNADTSVTNMLSFTNNVAHEPDPAPEASTISVAAGSTVYFVDGSYTYYEEATDVEVPAAAGIIYVNKGYTAQEVYAVDAEGVPTKVTALDNAVLGSDGANIRTSGVQGIRFRASVSNTAKALGLATSDYEIKEYGFIVTAETNKTGLLGTEYELDMNLVAEGKAVPGVAYNKADGTDIVYRVETDSTIFTNVIKNIPLTKSALQATIASRPYYIVTDGETETVLYGEITKKNVYEVAVSVKAAAGDDYTDNKDYIDSIISIVEDTQVAELATEIAIDVTKLYE